MRRLRGKWIASPGDFQHLGLWYPAGEHITVALKTRLEREEFYRADRFFDAMKHVTTWRGAVDCGAHVGAWSIQLAERFQRVVSIEMHPATVTCLQANLAAYPNAQAVHIALGEASGFASLQSPAGPISSCLEGDGYTVVRALDDLPEIAAMPAIDYLKIHVNGYELRVLHGAMNTIGKHQQIMTVVIKPALAKYRATQEDILNLMESIGYRVASRLKPYWVFAPR